jgi:hypothetical protein
MRPLVLMLSLIFPCISAAGDFSVHEPAARRFAKEFLKCLRDNDKDCLISHVDPEVNIDGDTFGCSQPYTSVLKRDQFVECLLKPARLKTARRDISEVLYSCFAPKSEYRDELTALRGKKKFWCFLSGDADEPLLKQVSLKYERMQ